MIFQAKELEKAAQDSAVAESSLRKQLEHAESLRHDLDEEIASLREQVHDRQDIDAGEELKKTLERQRQEAIAAELQTAIEARETYDFGDLNRNNNDSLLVAFITSICNVRIDNFNNMNRVVRNCEEIINAAAQREGDSVETFSSHFFEIGSLETRLSAILSYKDEMLEKERWNAKESLYVLISWWWRVEICVLYFAHEPGYCHLWQKKDENCRVDWLTLKKT